MSLTSKSCDRKGKEKVFRLHLNQITSCCQAYHENLDTTKTLDHYIDHWQHESSQLDQGQEIPGCEICWKHEQAGMPSYRQIADTRKINSIEISSSNLCNHMCSYCSPKFSSEWQKSIEDHGVFEKISSTAKLNQYPAKIALDTSQEYWLTEIKQYIARQPNNSISIKLLGGEPLMQMGILKRLLELNSDKIELLLINTNLNPPSSKFLHWMLETFPKEKLRFIISLDATTEYNHIPRAGFNRDRFLTNLALLEEHDIKFIFSPVLSVLSIFDIANFYSFITDHGYEIEFSQINNPDCLDPIYLPWEFKTRILDTDVSLPSLVKEILTTNTKSIDLKLFEQYNYLKQYFGRTKIDPTATPNALFNEYWTWLSNKGF
jgi:sulfatase maturation enzyme AslB (radical SAM superfamily)